MNDKLYEYRKICYRCEKPLAEIIDPEDPFGGYHGACEACRLHLKAVGEMRDNALRCEKAQ